MLFSVRALIIIVFVESENRLVFTRELNSQRTLIVTKQGKGSISASNVKKGKPEWKV